MITNYAANLVLNTLVGRTSSTNFGTNIYVALSTTAPTITGANFTEPVGNGYGRPLLGTSGQSYTQKMNAAASGKSVSGSVIHFPEATGPWGNCPYFGIFNAETGGNLLAFGALTASISPTAGTIPTVRIGDLTISLG